MAKSAQAPKTLSFADIADRKLEDIERPPLAPVGTYIFQCYKMPESSTTANGDWDIVNIPLRAVEAVEVDPEELAAFGHIKNIMLSVRVMFNKNDETEFSRSMFNLRRILEDHFKSATPDMTLKEALASVVNQRVLGGVSWKADKNDSDLFHANITKTAPVEA
jgi:hypothetical protein